MSFDVTEIFEPTCCLQIKNVFPQDVVDSFLQEAVGLAGDFEVGEFSEVANLDGADLADNSIKNTKDIWLDKYYKNRAISKILTSLDLYLWSEKIREVYASSSCGIFELLNHTTQSFTHLIRYGNEQHYDWHRDMLTPSGYGANTISYTFGSQDKQFKGGDFEISHNDVIKTFPFESNSLIIFPRSTLHRVTPIVMNKGFEDKPYYYRYSVQNWAH